MSNNSIYDFRNMSQPKLARLCRNYNEAIHQILRTYNTMTTHCMDANERGEMPNPDYLHEQSIHLATIMELFNQDNVEVLRGEISDTIEQSKQKLN